MGLEKSSLDLLIVSPPSPICRDLAGFQELYKQITICDFYFLKGFTPAVEIHGNVFFNSVTHHIILQISAIRLHVVHQTCWYSLVFLSFAMNIAS